MAGQAIAASADELVQRAHLRAYRFPVGFRGFTARLVWETDDDRGEGAVSARIGAASPADVEGAEGQEWVERELRSIVSHRTARPYEDSDGAYAKSVEDTGVLGTRVQIEDSMDSSYVVGAEGIALVTRSHAGQRFTIAIQHREMVGERELPTAFTVAYWDDAGRLVASEAYADAFVPLDGVLVPSRRTVVRADDHGLSVRRVSLFDHEPLDELGDAS